MVSRSIIPTRRPVLIALACVLILLASPLFSQESFEGLATVGRFGRFPSGLFGASNLVPPNTLVTVRNLETGRSERIIITDGVSEPGVFLVLSPEAAEALAMNPDAATRVRLVEVAGGGIPDERTLAERPLSADPDINPTAGGSLLDTLPPPQPAGDEADAATVAEAPDAEERPVTPAPPLVEALAQEPSPEPADEPAPEVAAEPETRPEPEPQPEAPADGGTRSGIAAGIARTSVGQAQESFERPETTLSSRRPVPESVPLPPEPGEPVVQAEERGTPGLETVTPAPDPEPPRTVLSPEPPPADLATEPDAPEPSDAVVQAPSSEPEEPDRASDDEADDVVTGPIDAALQSVVNRMPQKDLYPAPAGEDGDFGFRSVGRPEETEIVAELPQVEAPSIERPSLAGLAPLRALPEELDVDLAEATVPSEERPLFEGLAAPAAPGADVRSAALPEAVPGEELRPEGPGLARIAPGEAPSPAGPFAEASPGEELRPEGPGLARIIPDDAPAPAGPFAEAAPGEELRPEGGALVRVAPEEAADPEGPLAEADLPSEEAETDVAEAPQPEAAPEDEEADLSDLPRIAPDEGTEVAEALAEARPEDEVRADDPISPPEDIPEDAILALEPADFRPPEAPEPDEESLITREEADPEPDVAIAPAEPEPAPVETAAPAESEPAEPPETAQPPAEAARSPAEAAQPPAEAARSPAETAQPPAETAQPPAETARSPAEAARSPAETARSPAASALPVVADLEDNRFYLQIGAYSNPGTAEVAVNALGATYPMAVLPIEQGGRMIYRVLVGPLDRDETGTLLLWLRSRGYRETFIRNGSEL